MRGRLERPAGLVYVEELLDVDEEADWLAWCAELETEPVVMRGQESRRRIRHFGAGYDFASWAATAAEPLPARFRPLRGRCADLAGVEARSLVEALVTHYPPGASIGWHRDAAVFGSTVVGVSLGAAAVLRFQRRARGGERWVFEQPLAPRSAYVLSGSARHAWQHAVPAVADDRWSITFRQLRDARQG